MTSTSEQVVTQAAASKPVRVLARIGLLAYGVVHLLVAWLAVQVAIGDGGKADKGGALTTIASTTGGLWLLWLIAIGLGALTITQLAEAIWRHQRLRNRAMHLGEALLFAYLAYSAGKFAAVGKSPSDAEQSSLVARLLAEPYGKYLVVALGLGVLVAAGFVVHRGLTKGFSRDLDLGSASPSMRRVIVRFGQIGYTALGVVYGIAGALVVIAALRSEPSKATGLDTALKTLAAQPYGVVLLLAVAAGLAAFGAFAVLDARYRRS